MKHLILIFAIICSVINLNAQHLNRYKYAVIKESIDGNYGIPRGIADCLEEKGFIVFMEKDKDKTIEEQYTLYCNYYIRKNFSGPSTLFIFLKDSQGNVEMELSGSGLAMFIKGDMQIALREALIPLENLQYKFSSTFTESNFSISEDSIRDYLKNNKINEIEGIYKSIGTDIYYRIAVVKSQDKYVAKIIESNSPYWKNGATKAVFEPVRKSLFSATYYMANLEKKELFATYDDGILEVLFNDNSKTSFLKIFPHQEGESHDSSTNIATGETPKATGSGFFISGNIIATNYHVVRDASKIEICISDGDLSQGYKAKVLCSDVKNDLALVSIVDKAFTIVKDIPYSIDKETIDVGTSIFTMGYPMSNILGEEIKITDGIISSKTGFLGDVSTYQISAPIQPGNSGGGLFDKNGKLVGITNAGVRGAENVNYAIKTSYLLNLIDSAPIIIDLPQGRGLSGKKLPDIVKVLSPYIVFIKIY